MKKNANLHMLRGLIISMLTIVSSMCFAQKSVTYTFTGRNASSVTSSKPLGLYVSAGTAPTGVSVGTISGVESQDSEDDIDIDNVDIGNTVGLSLVPQYLVRPGEEGVITFKNFLYEIASINWTSRSQVPLLTSKTSTWAVKADKADGTSKTSTLTKEWSNDTYETSQFVTDNNFAGISALHISCDTKQALHGHSMKDFIISYYEPEITITAPDNIALSSSGKFSAAISDHAGAFTNATLTVTATTPDGTTVSLNDDNYSGSITSGTTVGAVILTAKLTYDGTVIATATKKVQIGNQDFNFIPSELYCEYLKSDDPDNVYAWYKLYTSEYNTNNFTLGNSGLRLSSQAPKSGNNDTNYWWTSTSNYASDYTNSSYASSGQITQIGQSTKCGYFRACMQPIDYQEFVPAYATASVDIQFTLSSTRTAYQTGLLIPDGARAGFLSAIYCFGDDKWPDGETTKTSSTYRYFSTNITSDQKGTSDREPLVASSNYSSNVGSSVTSTGTTTSKTFSFSNTGNSDGYVDQMKTQQLGAFSFVKYAARNTTISSSFGYTNRSKTITYYLYINYNANGGTGTMTTTEASSPETNATGTVAANTFTKAEDDNYTYQFIGWNTKADGKGTAYQSGDGINIYDAGNRCGAGPITLYAQWKAIKKATTTDLSEDDNVYSLWGNGGTINGEDVVAAQFVLGATASNVTPATRSGYTFNGYYTSTTGGTQIFDENGAAIGDGTIISTTGRWLAENDVYLYAQWEKDATKTVKTITVTLNGNKPSAATVDVTLPTSSITCTEDNSENCNISTLTPTLSGYKFAGWYTNATGNADGSIMVYNANGEAVYVESYSTDSEGNITPVYTALNPTFFYTSGKYVGSESPFDANFTIYAHWIKESTKLSFNEYVTTNKKASWYDGSTTGYFDSNSAPAYEEGEYDEVSITRALNANKWNTVCFPFDIYEGQVKDLFTYVKMFNDLEVDGNTAKMKFADCTVMMAGVPYFVKIKSDSNLTGLTLSKVSVCKTPSPISITKDNTTVTMVGEFNTHLGLEAGLLFLQNDKFYISGNTYNGKKITGNSKGFRCYFTNTTKTNEAKACNLLSTSIDLEGYDGYSGTTDVEQLEINPDNCTFSIEPTEVYDLCGRKLAGKPEKGIYLTNGKKYIAR